MPTANANVGATAGDAVAYATQEKKKGVPENQKAILFESNQVSGNARDIGFQMKDISDDRPAVKKPVLHLQISFHPDEKPTPVQAKAVIDSILKDIGIEKMNHQYVVVQHRDKPHDHYHIVANRVGLDGSLVNDHRIIDRLQVACSRVEQELDLRPTTGRTVVYDKQSEQGFKYVKPEISADFKEVKSKNPKIKEIQAALIEVIKVATTPEALVDALKLRNIDVQFSKKSDGSTFGISFRTEGVSVKGTSVGYKWKDIQVKLTENVSTQIAKLVIATVVNIPEIIQAKPVLRVKKSRPPRFPTEGLIDIPSLPLRSENRFAPKVGQVEQIKPAVFIKDVKNEALAAFIRANIKNIPDPLQLTDQAIRVVFSAKEGEPHVNPWTAFQEYAEAKGLTKEKGYDILYDFATAEFKLQSCIEQPLAKTIAVVPDQAFSVIRLDIQQGIESYIYNNADHIKDADVLVSRAIIAVYQKLEPSEPDPIKAFESLSDQQKIYDKLIDYAEQKIADKVSEKTVNKVIRR